MNSLDMDLHKRLVPRERPPGGHQSETGICSSSSPFFREQDSPLQMRTNRSRHIHRNHCDQCCIYREMAPSVPLEVTAVVTVSSLPHSNGSRPSNALAFTRERPSAADRQSAKGS
jgi:hypothetical protein